MNKVCEGLISFNMEGNVIPISWYSHIKTKNNTIDQTAITLLADIIYWYRPVEIRDEYSGEIIEYKQKFKADKLQKSYQNYSELFGYSKIQVKRSIDNLIRLGLITREFRNIKTKNGLSINNVMFIEPSLNNVFAISHKPTLQKSKHTPHKKVNTNTDITYNNDLFHKSLDGSASQNHINNSYDNNISKFCITDINLINYWNKLNNVPKHKKMDTKVYKKSCDMLKRLRNGTFSKHYSINSDFMKNNNIKSSDLRIKWSITNIKKAMNNVSLFYTEGYWPLDKSKIPKTLPNLIFNAYSGNSFFLKAFFNPPEKLSNKIHSIPVNKELYAKYKKVYANHIRNPKDEENLIMKVNNVYKFFDEKMKVVLDNYWMRLFKSPIPLMERHIEWLNKRNDVYFSYLETDSTMFTNFLIHLDKEHHSWNFAGIDKNKQKRRQDKNQEKAQQDYYENLLFD